MTTATHVLAAFAAGLTYDRIPAEVIGRAKDCILDTVGVAVFGSELPWSRFVVDYARRYGAGGHSTILGPGNGRAHAPFGALANGALAHAFELDSLRQPGAGVHPGASVAVPALAIAEEIGASGKDLLTAFVAGCEVMFRIGTASRHTSETLGFHAPGLTGPYGAAVAAGRLLGLSPEQMVNALGIAGSLSSGLLAFTRAGSGAMVKRLHLGRAAEGGVLAACLARDGFTGPDTILDGPFGFLEVYCREPEAARLTAGIGQVYETLRICLKRYPCHITAHAPVQAVQELKAEHGFTGHDVAGVTIAGSERVMRQHNIPEPLDIMMAQYSVPFCVALALFRDPEEPRSFSDEGLKDPLIRSLSRNTRLAVQAPSTHGKSAWASRVTIQLRDGRELAREVRDFKGTPAQPLSREEVGAKFLRLTASLGPAAAERLLHRLERLEAEPDISRLGLSELGAGTGAN